MGQADMLVTGMLIALMVLSFYFLILRPGRRRQQEQAKTMRSLVPGARVLLASGVYGNLVSKDERQAVVEIAPGVAVTVVPHAIVQVITQDEATGAGASGEHDAEPESEKRAAGDRHEDAIQTRHDERTQAEETGATGSKDDVVREPHAVDERGGSTADGTR